MDISSSESTLGFLPQLHNLVLEYSSFGKLSKDAGGTVGS